MNVTHTQNIYRMTSILFFYVDFMRNYFKSEQKRRRNIRTSKPNEERKTNVIEHDWLTHWLTELSEYYTLCSRRTHFRREHLNVHKQWWWWWWWFEMRIYTWRMKMMNENYETANVCWPRKKKKRHRWLFARSRKVCYFIKIVNVSFEYQ